MQIPSTGANPFAFSGASALASAGSAAGSPVGLPSGSAAGSASSGDSAVQNFLNYVGMTPAEQMRSSILSSMGLTEADLDKMDPKDRAKVEEQIKEMILHKVQEATEKQTGVVVDFKA
jgi:3-oxoacyl-ACP reductase-like protein